MKDVKAVVALVAALSWMTGPGALAALADDGRGIHREGGLIRTVPGQPGPPPGGHRPPHGHHPQQWYPPSPYLGWGYEPPYVIASPPMYEPPLVVTVPAPYPSVTPAPPSVIEYPDGRYELRGDGLTIPYMWVWLPNPPAPPAEAEAATPVSSSSVRDVNDIPAPPADLYRWVDREGVVHWTDDPSTVPAPHRTPVKRPGS